VSGDVTDGDVTDARVVGLFQQSSMKGKGTIGFVADPVVCLPLRTQPDHQMVVVLSSEQRLTL
jgi:hypothetical protein